MIQQRQLGQRDEILVTICPWCFEDFPCKGHCTLKVGRRGSAVYLGDGMMLMTGWEFSVVRKASA